MSASEHLEGRAALSSVRRGLNRLDKKSVIALDQEYLGLRREVKPALEFVRSRTRGLGSSSKVEVLRDLEKLLAMQRESSRAAEYRGRLLCEISEAVREKRFVVFNSLSCDNEWLPKVFKRGSNLWRIQKEKWRKDVQAAAEKAGEEAYFSYFCIPEEGGETGRLHFHCVVVMSHLPAGCQDMNPFAGGVRREIDALRRWWPYGTSSPIAVRWAGDAYSELGWRWPSRKEVVDGEEKIVPVSSSGGRLANYLVKYLIKQKGEEWKRKAWRVKMSRRFGMQKLSAVVEQASEKGLVALVAWSKSREFSQVRLVRRVAKLELGRRMYRRALSHTGGQDMASRFLNTVPRTETLFSRLSRSVLKTRDSMPRSVGEWTLAPSSEGISEARRLLYELKEYFALPSRAVGQILG
jgi:hypothetical protein